MVSTIDNQGQFLVEWVSCFDHGRGPSMRLFTNRMNMGHTWLH
jgi:hypothetical protein